MTDKKTPTVICLSCNFAFCGQQDPMPLNATVTRVQCIGRLDPVSVLEVFEKGADGVILAGCKFPDCHFQEGNEQAELAVSILKRLLSLSGLGAERLKLLLVSPFEEQQLSSFVKIFADEVSKLGESPLKGSEAEAKYMVNLIAAKNAAAQFRMRVLLGREKELTENANVFGEKVPQKNYEAMLDEIVEDEFIRFKIHFLTRNVPMSVRDLAQATGLKPSEVLEHIVDMRRKNMLAVDRIEETSPLYRALEV
jgi:F420-non-reducing hydrogenase iron-sulfur subunit